MVTSLNQLSVRCSQNSKKKDVRINNIEAAKAVADAVRTSLGPRGMDKMVGCLIKGCHMASIYGNDADTAPFRCAKLMAR